MKSFMYKGKEIFLKTKFIEIPTTGYKSSYAERMEKAFAPYVSKIPEDDEQDYIWFHLKRMDREAKSKKYTELKKTGMSDEEIVKIVHPGKQLVNGKTLKYIPGQELTPQQERDNLYKSMDELMQFDPEYLAMDYDQQIDYLKKEDPLIADDIELLREPIRIIGDNQDLMNETMEYLNTLKE